ncbi:MAG: hypothetical protein ACYTEL_09720 [Planctomycetota bacterium]
MAEICSICGCTLHRKGDYAKPTIKGRSHSTKHHYVAERFFGRSANRKGTQREPVFAEDPWGMEGKKDVFCYDCHEELLHNPVFLPEDIDLLAHLVRARHLDEREKTEDRSRLAGRIMLLHEVLKNGLQVTLEGER